MPKGKFYLSWLSLRTKLTVFSGSNFEHLLAPTTDFLAAIASISGDPPTKPAAVPAYSENSTFFSQGGDTTAKSKKVAESSKKTPNKESHKKGQAANEETPKKDHGTKENTPKKGSASKAPKKGPTPKQKQKQPVPSAPKADNKKPVTIPHGPKGGSKPEAPTAQPPPVEAKSTTPPPVAGPSNEDPPNIPEPLDESIAVKATTSNILDTEVPRTPNSTEGVVEFQANNSFASSLPQPEDEPDSEEDAAPDDLSDLLLDFSTPPSPGRKDKAPAKESGPAMGELVDLSSRAEADFFTGDTQQFRTYEGTCDTASLSAYPNFMGTTPEISAKQLELDQLKRFLNQEHGSDMFGYLTRRKAVLEEELAGMKKDHAAGNAVESESPVMDKIEKHNSQTLVDTSIPKVHVENRVPYQQQVGSNAAQISGLKISNLIGTHNLPGRSKTTETGSGSTPPDVEPKMEKGHERKSTVLSQSSTDTSGSRMRSKPYIPYSAAAMQYAPEYFKGLEEESKRIEELKDGVNALTLDSPTKNTVGHPVSPSPTPIPPKPEVTSNPVARTAPFFPDTAATRQYSRNFSNDPFVASSSDDQVRRTSATSTSVRSDKAPSKTSRLSPSVAPFQPSGMASTAMPSVFSATSGTTKPNVNEPKAGQGLYASKYATPSKPRVASGLEASKYAAPPVPKFEQKSTPPKYAYSPQRTPSQGIDASQYAQSPKRKASYGLDASKYAQPPKRPANQGLEASKYASPVKSQSGQGLGASKYASPSPTPKPGQGLYASKHAPPAKSQTGQGLEASKYESPSPTPKPNQGLYASKHAPPATTQSGQGLEASKYAFPAPKPEQGLYASKYAPLAKSQSGQGLEASRYASTSNSKPERGLFASKYAPRGGADMPEGLEDFKSGSYPRSRGHQRK